MSLAGMFDKLLRPPGLDQYVVGGLFHSDMVGPFPTRQAATVYARQHGGTVARLTPPQDDQQPGVQNGWVRVQ